MNRPGEPRLILSREARPMEGPTSSGGVGARPGSPRSGLEGGESSSQYFMIFRRDGRVAECGALEKR